MWRNDGMMMMAPVREMMWRWLLGNLWKNNWKASLISSQFLWVFSGMVKEAVEGINCKFWKFMLYRILLKVNLAVASRHLNCHHFANRWKTPRSCLRAFENKIFACIPKCTSLLKYFGLTDTVVISTSYELNILEMCLNLRQLFSHKLKIFCSVVVKRYHVTLWASRYNARFAPIPRDRSFPKKLNTHRFWWTPNYSCLIAIRFHCFPIS